MLENKTRVLPAIFSSHSLTLSDSEARFFRESDPLGFILFGRNIDTPEQVKRLTDGLRHSVGRDCPILIDQEGGRVQRMKPPHWTACPSAQSCSSVEDVKNAARIIAQELVSAGIDVNCAPVMDVLHQETHQAIGDRAFSDDPQDVFQKAQAVCDVFLEYGITPTVKHIPGQGRAAVDSHHDLPVVKASVADLQGHDFIPFSRISRAPEARLIWGMVSHVVYEAIDPAYPATLSPAVIKVIREQIGFDGLLCTDDMSMGALKTFGNIAENSKTALESGIDIALYCWAQLTEMESLASTLPRMSSATKKRYDRSRIRRRSTAST